MHCETNTNTKHVDRHMFVYTIKLALSKRGNKPDSGFVPVDREAILMLISNNNANER